jgi:hypothetical protein
MKLRKLLRTKTFWAGIGTIGTGVYLIVNGNVVEGIQSISGGLGMIFIRDALVK